MTEQDLTFVRLTDDGRKLVLVSATGEELTLVVDETLRTAVRTAPRYGRLEKTMESTLRPRDIQARIRAGETPESVAAAAQTTIDRVMGYATPVLAERAHIAERAQRASVRRRGNEGPSRLLGDAVTEQLKGRNIDPASVEWDAWRREDGRWTLLAEYAVDGAPARAEFVFDMPGRYVVPEDDTARWLVGEAPAVTEEPPAPGRRLSAVGDVELPLGEDAIGMVTEQQPATGPDDTTADLTATARAVRHLPAPPQHPGYQPGHHPGHPSLDPTAVTGDGDWMATQATERPAAPAAPATPPAAAEEPQPEQAAARAEEPGTVEEQAPAADEQPARRTAKSRRGRASVPSWDEIMFGGGRSE